MNKNTIGYPNQTYSQAQKTYQFCHSVKIGCGCTKLQLQHRKSYLHELNHNASEFRIMKFDNCEGSQEIDFGLNLFGSRNQSEARSSGRINQTQQQFSVNKLDTKMRNVKSCEYADGAKPSSRKLKIESSGAKGQINQNCCKKQIQQRRTANKSDTDTTKALHCPAYAETSTISVIVTNMLKTKSCCNLKAHVTCHRIWPVNAVPSATKRVQCTKLQR